MITFSFSSTNLHPLLPCRRCLFQQSQGCAAASYHYIRHLAGIQPTFPTLFGLQLSCFSKRKPCTSESRQRESSLGLQHTPGGKQGTSPTRWLEHQAAEEEKNQCSQL